MSRYNIETAKSAGFCFGVKRAVEIAEKAAEENGCCYTLGELIHNGSEIARLQKLGVYPIDSPDDLPQGRTLIIRSHGVAKSVTDYINDKGISCIDATCPFVAKIHNIVSKSECPVIIAGDPDHPEVIGIVGHCRNPDEVTVVRDSDELEKLSELQKFPRQNALIMVAQTTFNSSKWQSCIQVAIYDNRLEVTSPGGLYNGLTYEEVMNGHSKIRNKAIANIFSQMGLVEAWGSGIKRILNAAKEYGLPEPKFQEFDNMFRVELFRNFLPMTSENKHIGETSEKHRRNIGETWNS